MSFVKEEFINTLRQEGMISGGYNKPKIQWVDWNNDGFDELFLLDEDGKLIRKGDDKFVNLLRNPGAEDPPAKSSSPKST